MKIVYSIGNLYIVGMPDGVSLRLTEDNKTLNEVIVRDDMLDLIKALADASLVNYLNREIKSYQDMIQRRLKDIEEEEAFISKHASEITNKQYLEERVARWKEDVANWKRRCERLSVIRDYLIALVEEIDKWRAKKNER